MKDFSPSEIEAKWQQRWAESGMYDTDLKKAKEPYYSLVMFPYPSGDKLHVGHWYNFAPADSFARYQRMLGKDVFEPMGFDAFGLPAENYAIKTGVHPSQSIKENVETMITQLKRMGCMYDWSKMVNTSSPEYYQWTQWLFLQMYNTGLAYKKKANVNWCPKDQTVLANEQVKEGLCERCGTQVVQKPLEQWFWKITDYAQRLLDGLKDLEWPEKTKTMQRNWIGRSEGVNFKCKIKDLGTEIEVYDSIPQTHKAQTFAVIAPDHPMVKDLVAGTEHEKDVLKFAEKIAKKKAAGKFDIDTDMEGIFTGRYVEDPFGMGDLPIWVASFVVTDYGTGIVLCSAHDERDFAFAKKYDLPLRPVLLPQDPDLAELVKKGDVFYRQPDGIMQLPAAFKGMTWAEAREPIIDYIEKSGLGYRAVHYRLRDWLVSRQRYWGAPIPIVYDPEGNPHPVPEEHLPWLLPTDVEFKPTGESPLRQSKELIERTEKIFGKGWRPEFDTMDTFVCSSFYYLRYLMAGERRAESSKQGAISSKQKAVKKLTAHGLGLIASPREQQLIDPAIEKKWLPVDMYIGGPEHATMHLIYARFVMMALHDAGIVSHDEPFKRLVHQGLITNKGAKMSKSKNNAVSPDAFVERYGADVFRMFLMFMGPFTDGGDWSDTGIKGVDRFVQRMWKLITEKVKEDVDDDALKPALHKTIKRVTESVERLQFNTAISALMEFLNAAEKFEKISATTARTLALLLAPLAPHLSEELWEKLGGKGFAIEQSWPTYDEALLVSTTLTIAVQINGKLRGTIEVPADASDDDIKAAAKAEPNVEKYLKDATIKKEIYVKGKLVSFVV